MKRLVFFCGLACIFAASGPTAQTPGKIPRRVFVSPINETALSTVPEADRTLLASTTRYLFTELTSLKPVVRVSNAASANSVLTVNIRPSGGSLEITCAILEGASVKAEERFFFPSGLERFAEYETALRRIAEKFVPFMEDVEPIVSIERSEQEARKKRIIDDVSFAESLNRPLELTIWGPGFTHAMVHRDETDGKSKIESDFYASGPIHWTIDVAYYPAHNWGLVASCYVDRNDDAKLLTVSERDSIDEGSGVTALKYCDTENTYILGGLGFSVRTLGRLSAGFNALLYFGTLTIRAKEDTYFISDAYDPALDLKKGESKTFPYALISAQPSIAYAFNQRFSLKIRWTFTIAPSVSSQSNEEQLYNRDDFLRLTFGELGIAYRL